MSALLRELREGSGFTKQYVDRNALGRAYSRHIEADLRPFPPDHRIRKLADLYGISFRALWNLASLAYGTEVAVAYSGERAEAITPGIRDLGDYLDPIRIGSATDLPFPFPGRPGSDAMREAYQSFVRSTAPRSESLHALRDDLGLTQSGFARRVGVRTSAVEQSDCGKWPLRESAVTRVLRTAVAYVGDESNAGTTTA